MIFDKEACINNTFAISVLDVGRFIMAIQQKY